VSVRKLPSGTVTLLFTDIEGSTRLLDELGKRYAQVLAEHRRTLREVFSRHGGVEVNTEGDSFFVAFTRASDAVLAANGIQDALVDGPVHVRIGIHTGEPVVTEEGYVGLDVHRAARISGIDNAVDLFPVIPAHVPNPQLVGARSLGETERIAKTMGDNALRIGIGGSGQGVVWKTGTGRWVDPDDAAIQADRVARRPQILAA
jgi:Adenylate and Guanylate cyclase catalytic domain